MHQAYSGCRLWGFCWNLTLCPLPSRLSHTFFLQHRHTVIPYSTTIQPIHLAYKRLSSRNCQLFQLVGWNPPFEPRLSCNEQRRHLQLPWQMRMNEQNVNPRASALQNAVKFQRENKRKNKEKHKVGPFLFYIPLHKRRSQQRNESETPCRSAWDLASCKFSYGCKLTLLQLRPDAKSMCLEGERSIWAIHVGGLQYYPTAPRYSTWINRDPDAQTPYVCVGIRTALRQSSTVAAVDSTCDALQRH